MPEATTTFSEPFDPAKEDGTPARALLPAGKYRAQVTDASVSETKKRNGTMLNLTWQILNPGPAENRLVFQTILTRHESPDAQRIGRQKLKDLCDACSITEAVTDVGVFLHKPCLISVGIEHDKDGIYTDKNKVTRIASAAPTSMPPPAAAPGVKPNGAKAKPAAKRTDNSDMDDEIPF